MAGRPAAQPAATASAQQAQYVPAPTGQTGAGAAPQTNSGQPAVQQPPYAGAAATSGGIQPPPAQMSSSKRGFYIALGAALAVVFLVLTAMKLPMFRGNSSDSSRNTVTAPPAAAPAPVTPGAASSAPTSAPSTPATAGGPAADTPPAGAAPVAATKPAAKPAGPSAEEKKAKEEAAAAAAAAQAAAEEAARLLDEQEKRFVHMSARAGAMKDSFEILRQQQQASGFAPSSALSTPYNTMQQYMGRAEAALQAGDGAAAKKYMDLAEPQIRILEQKFGR